MKGSLIGSVSADNSFPPSKHLHRKPQEQESRHPRQIITLETLPTEILQQIFFAALNGNILHASPRIAVKLSGSQNIKRTAFIISFYPQNLVELRRKFRFHYLLPELQLPVPSWELRSMVKAVLDSRWCKWSWVQNLLSGLLHDAVTVFQRDYAAIRNSDTEGHITENFREFSDLHAYPINGTGRLGGAVNKLRIFLFDMSITSLPVDTDIVPVDEDGRDWEETEHWRLQFHTFGTISFDALKLDSTYPRDTPFRTLVHQSFGLSGISARQTALALWQRLDKQIYEAIIETDNSKLRDLLQMEYFLRPENLSFKISSTVYRAAAKSDHSLFVEVLDGLEDNSAFMPSLLHTLFAIDPSSLPRDAFEIQQWIFAAWTRVKNHASKRNNRRVENRLDMENDFMSQGDMKEWRTHFRAEDYGHEADKQILRYFLTGVLATKPNMLSPDFSSPVLWRQDEEIDEEYICAGEDEITKIVRPLNLQQLISLLGGCLYSHERFNGCSENVQRLLDMLRAGDDIANEGDVDGEDGMNGEDGADAEVEVEMVVGRNAASNIYDQPTSSDAETQAADTGTEIEVGSQEWGHLHILELQSMVSAHQSEA